MPNEAQNEVQRRSDNNYSSAIKRFQDVLPDQSWRGRRCFVVGGGESLSGFNFSRLDKELTIGINKSFIYYDSSLLFFSDSNFYHQMILDEAVSPLWHKFPGIKATTSPLEVGRTYPDVHVIRRSNKLELPHSLEDGINVWNNSGFGALVLAYLLGANPIYLLGFDLKCVRTTHWHCGYPGQNIDGQNSRMHSFMMPFNMTADEFKARGIHVVNLNPDSALTCYHKTTISKIL